MPLQYYNLALGGFSDLMYLHCDGWKKYTKAAPNVNLFAAEMKYLHEKGFKVFNMDDVGYDKEHNYLYIKH